MKEQIKLVEDFHKKFNALISKKPTLIPKDRSDLRFRLMDEEVWEYKQWVENNDIENISKELCDILYTVYWTIIEHWLQDKIEDMFLENHKSQMSKDYHEYKMIKWKSYFKANIKKHL